MNLYSTLL